jgi:hypothetical protein
MRISLKVQSDKIDVLNIIGKNNYLSKIKLMSALKKLKIKKAA